MSATPYMPLYIADYMADAAHLSTVEHGAYMLLIMTYWQRGKALHASNGRLANVARLSNEEWEKIEPTLAEFFEIEGDFWVHKRVERELEAFRSKSEKARAAGKASAERRSSARSTPVQRPSNHTDTDADAELESSNELSPQRAKRAASASEFGQQIGNEFETVFWVEYPARIDRKAAAQKFLIARRKHSLDTIMAGLRSYKAGKPDWQQWKSPAAWLNGEKFLDDHAARAGPEPPPHPHEFERQQQRLREEAARKFGIAQ